MNKRGLRLPLGTQRLVLREFVAGDYDAVYAYASDPRVTRYMLYGPRDPMDTREYLNRVIGYQSDQPRTIWEIAVTQRADGALVGAGDITILKAGEGDLGYMLRHDVWGKGYASEVASALIDAGFRDLGLNRIFSTVSTENTRSMRVLEKARMRWEAHYRRFAQAKGRWWDCHLYATSRPEWEATRHD
ncbi:MAG: GNAT family N-acetyltransferase [Steroidobacteraceae bacterium]